MALTATEESLVIVSRVFYWTELRNTQEYISWVYTDNPKLKFINTENLVNLKFFIMKILIPNDINIITVLSYYICKIVLG